jgi:hypothetical protein
VADALPRLELDACWRRTLCELDDTLLRLAVGVACRRKLCEVDVELRGLRSTLVGCELVLDRAELRAVVELCDGVEVLLRDRDGLTASFPDALDSRAAPVVEVLEDERSCVLDCEISPLGADRSTVLPGRACESVFLCSRIAGASRTVFTVRLACRSMVRFTPSGRATVTVRSPILTSRRDRATSRTSRPLRRPTSAADGGVFNE